MVSEVSGLLSEESLSLSDSFYEFHISPKVFPVDISLILSADLVSLKLENKADVESLSEVASIFVISISIDSTSLVSS